MSKKFSILTLATALSAVMINTAYAENISYVRFEYSYDVLTEAADPSTIQFKTYSTEYTYEWKSDAEKASYKIGDNYHVTFDLTAKEGNDFKGIKPYACKIGEVSSEKAEVSADGTKLSLSFSMPALNVRLCSPERPQLTKEGFASWEPVEHADGYSVKLQHLDTYGYRNYITEFKTNDTHADLSSNFFASPGDYLYTVTAVSDRYFYESSEETELPLDSSLYVTSDMVGEPKSILSERDGTAYLNNGYVKNKQLLIAGSWYYFGDDTKWVTGWISEGGKWYYFDPATHKRVKGLQKIEGKEYYFDRTSGIMMTGFQNADGKEMFFGPDGYAQYGWVEDDNKTYFILPDGSRNTKQLIDKDLNTYFFRSDGSLVFKK